VLTDIEAYAGYEAVNSVIGKIQDAIGERDVSWKSLSEEQLARLCVCFDWKIELWFRGHRLQSQTVGTIYQA
jgi:hypothetical protein